MAEEQVTEEEKEILSKYLEGFGAQIPEEKYNVHTFLNKVATSDDTTKTGFLTIDELGNSEFPVRSYKSFALWSDKVIKSDYLRDYFNAESEIETSSSLSREGFLIKMAVTQKKELADTTKKPRVNTGWFKKKEPEE